MSASRRHHARRAGRWPRERAAAAALFVGSVLVFSWPFVRSPPLDLGTSFLHVLAAWGLSVAGLAAMARAAAPSREDRDRDA